MGRVLLYFSTGALAVFVLAATFVIDRGGGYTEGVVEVSVHDLLLLPDRYRGRDVTTEGVLRFDSTTDGYLVTEDGQGIIVHSEADLALMDDSRARVTGRFDWTKDEGVFIEASTVTPIGE